MSTAESSLQSTMETASAQIDSGAGSVGSSTLLSREPALVFGAIIAVLDAGLALVFAFVATFTVEQQAAMFGFITAVTALIGAIATRSQVTPVAKT